MPTLLVPLLTLVPLLGLAPAAEAHIGDEIYPIFELFDEDLGRIDLTDGSVEDWLEVVGSPPWRPATSSGGVPELQRNMIPWRWTSASGSPGTGAAVPSGRPWSASTISTSTATTGTPSTW